MAANENFFVIFFIRVNHHAPWQDIATCGKCTSGANMKIYDGT